MPVLINHAFTHVVDAMTQGQQPSAEALRAVLNDIGLRRQLISQRDVSDALAQAATVRSGVSCADVEEELPVLIDAEQSGAMLDLLVSVQMHIQACAYCMDLYCAAGSLNHAQTTGQAPQWPKLPPLLSLAIPPSIMPLVVTGHEIQHAVRQVVRHRRMRGTGAQAGPMLYAGPVPGHPDLFIDIQLAGAVDDSTAQQALRVQIQGTAAIENRTITLQHNSEIRSGRTNNTGEALIPDIPASWVNAEAGDLLIFIGPA